MGAKLFSILSVLSSATFLGEILIFNGNVQALSWTHGVKVARNPTSPRRPVTLDFWSKSFRNLWRCAMYRKYCDPARERGTAAAAAAGWTLGTSAAMLTGKSFDAFSFFHEYKKFLWSTIHSIPCVVRVYSSASRLPA